MARYVAVMLAHDFLFEIDMQGPISFADLNSLIELLGDEGVAQVVKYLDGMGTKMFKEIVENYENLIAMSLINKGGKLLSEDMKLGIMIVDFFSKSNQRVPRMPRKDFINEACSDMLDMNIVATDYYRLKNRPGAGKEFLLLNYPWFFSTEAKVDVLQVENYCVQNSEIFNQITQGGFMGLMNMNSMHLAITVRRHNILEDALNRLSNQGRNLKKPLRVSFAGEAGVDAGGVKKEFFQLLSKELLNPQYAMFVTKNVEAGNAGKILLVQHAQLRDWSELRVDWHAHRTSDLQLGAARVGVPKSRL